MSYEITEYPHTKVTDKSKAFEKECGLFAGMKSIFSNIYADIDSLDTMYMLRGLFEAKEIRYYMRVLHMDLLDDGLIVKIPVKNTDDIGRIVFIMGKPTNIEEGDDGTIYAIWIRNILSWF